MLDTGDMEATPVILLPKDIGTSAQYADLQPRQRDG